MKKRTVPPARPRVLMTTEGTYPYAAGGVSTWCSHLVHGLPELRWQILPITAGNLGREPMLEVPAHATVLGRIELWSARPPPLLAPSSDRSPARTSLPADLARGLLHWEGDLSALEDSLLYCRRSAHHLRRVFRDPQAWKGYLAALEEVLDERPPGAGANPEVDLHHASELYHSLYWVARVASVPTPPTDLLLATAAGWAAVPALVHRAIHGTPLVVVEHGVYVREGYLISLRADTSPSARFIHTRLARGLARAAYAGSDVISPVSEANAYWEKALGVPSDRIVVIQNAVSAPGEPLPLPGNATVIAMGRLDPLKDVHTLLEVAAEVMRHVPEARFLHYGPVPAGQEGYARSCEELHARLGLGDRFRFMGHTPDPVGVLRDADVLLMTSISEGFPMTLLEAMSVGRPVVSTWVGGVPEATRGCGILAPPGDVHELAMGVVTLLRDRRLAETLGARGHRRVATTSSHERWLRQSRELLLGLVAAGRASA